MLTSEIPLIFSFSFACISFILFFGRIVSHKSHESFAHSSDFVFEIEKRADKDKYEP